MGRRWNSEDHSSSVDHWNWTGPACLEGPPAQRRQGIRQDGLQGSPAEALLGLEGPVMDRRDLEGSHELVRSRLRVSQQYKEVSCMLQR